MYTCDIVRALRAMHSIKAWLHVVELSAALRVSLVASAAQAENRTRIEAVLVAQQVAQRNSSTYIGVLCLAAKPC
jgi:hypothetical protein